MTSSNYYTVVGEATDAKEVSMGELRERMQQDLILHGIVARVEIRDRDLRHRRLSHQGLQHVLGLTALLGIGSGHHDPQRHGAGITG